MSKLVSADNLLTAFPTALAEDEMKLALATVTATELVKLYEDNDILALYARIDDLDETLLDILAYDFKVDWWDGNWGVEEKRDTFKSIWHVRSTLGTAYAPESALSAIYQKTVIKEWWEYGGKPFYFKINLSKNFGEDRIDKNTIERLYKMLEITKNKRSKLDELTIEAVAEFGIGVSVVVGKRHRRSIIPSAKRAIEAKGTTYIGTILANQHRNVIIYPARDADIGYNL